MPIGNWQREAIAWCGGGVRGKGSNQPILVQVVRLKNHNQTATIKRNPLYELYLSTMEVDESGTTPRDGNSRASSRTSRRSPMPPPMSTGIILNRPLGTSTTTNTNSGNAFATLPRSHGSAYQRDYSCPPPASKFSSNRRSSSGIFITSMFGSRFRHLQKLHSDAFVMGLNAVCYPGLPMGTMFRSSLPATPVCTPIHREAFQQFTEQALRDRLCRTPSPRKHRGYPPLDLHLTDMHMTNDSRSMSRISQGSDQPMDITCPSTPITEPLPEGGSNDESSGSNGSPSGTDSQSSIIGRPPAGLNKRIFPGNVTYRGGDYNDQT